MTGGREILSNLLAPSRQLRPESDIPGVLHVSALLELSMITSTMAGTQVSVSER